ncbi:hypothetical protein ACSAZL_05390 [Methanosarcina sp. T3]|uniref:hypothetical protein n=1 Tax=Methanosarcina sp. T3 TaxID=3439062 RepID=UPI003F844BBE
MLNKSYDTTYVTIESVLQQNLLAFHPENEFHRTYAGNTLNNLETLYSEKGQKAEAKENFEKRLIS